MKYLTIQNGSNTIMEGVLIVDKPFGYTSHDIVAIIRRLTKIKKVGHLGTLDPMATGVLPLVLGRATVLSRFLMEGIKKYIAWIRLGFYTDTYDIEGEKSVGSPKIDLDQADVRKCLKSFKGKINQQPPAYSARKVNGKKLYKSARKGKIVKSKPKQIIIHRIKLLNFSADRLSLNIQCSAGTYIRSVAHDLGQKLGCGAYLSSLIRVASGSFHLLNAISLEEIELLSQRNELDKKIVPLSQILNNLPSLTLPASCSSSLHKKIEREKEFLHFPCTSSAKEGYYRILGQQGRLLAIAKTMETPKDGNLCLKPEFFFINNR